MIKPASSLCDMKCSYCFYSDVAASRQQFSMGIMNKEAAASIIKNIFSVLTAGDHITFGFQGGEPGLAGLDFFLFFVKEAKKAASSPKIQIHYSLQTNGLMIDDKWCKFFKENNFLIGLSVDGDAALHNKNRMDNHGKGTFNIVMAAKKLLDNFKVDYNILCVLTSEGARRAKRIWDFILKEKIKYIQFIPCLEPFNQKSPYALTSEKFYRFYSDIFSFWKREVEKGNFVSVRLFDDLATLMMSGRPATCGLSGRCSPQIIVEADGSVYPCDFYVLDEYRAGDLTKDNLQQIFKMVAESEFLKEARQMPAWCEGCVYNTWCKGGCKRMAQAVYGEHCGMRKFLDENWRALCRYLPSKSRI